MCRLWVSAVQAGYLPQICRIYAFESFNLCSKAANLVEPPHFSHLASGYLWLVMLASFVRLTLAKRLGFSVTG